MDIIKRSWPLLVIVIIFSLAIFFDLPHYFKWDTFKLYHDRIQAYAHEHFITSILIFMAIYAISVAVSIPGAAFLTLMGGFLFGPVIGSIIVVIAATIGAVLVFLAVKYFLGDWAESKAQGAVKAMRAGFAEDALSYLLILRLIPLFPFWLVNIVPAILSIDVRIFTLATFFGIMPGTVVFVSIGNGISHLLEIGQQPNLGIIFAPQILLPLIGLAILSLLPVIYKRLKRKKQA